MEVWQSITKDANTATKDKANKTNIVAKLEETTTSYAKVNHNNK